MPDRTSRRPIAALCGILALAGIALGVGWGSIWPAGRPTKSSLLSTPVPGHVGHVTVQLYSFPVSVWWSPPSHGSAQPVLAYLATDAQGNVCRVRVRRGQSPFCMLPGVHSGLDRVTVVAQNRYGDSTPETSATFRIPLQPIARPWSTPLSSYKQSVASGYGGVLAVGAPVNTKTTVWTISTSSRRCIGRRCVALAATDFQYPVVSEDHGRTWRVAGHWFAGDWADGAAFATGITMLSPSVWLAPNGISADGFYLTMNAGRTWRVTGVGGWEDRNQLSRGRLLVTESGTWHGLPAYATYSTIDGASWRLVSVRFAHDTVGG